LAETQLDCKQALELALLLEKAANGAQELQGIPMEVDACESRDYLNGTG